MQEYIAIKELSVGDELPPRAFDLVAKVQLVRYAGASGDFNPLHTDDSVAQEAGLSGVIAQGPLIMGFIGQAMAKWFPVRNLRKFGVRFRGMTFPGDVITVKAMVIEKTDKAIVCDVTACDQQEQVKVTGQCVLSE